MRAGFQKTFHRGFNKGFHQGFYALVLVSMLIRFSMGARQADYTLSVQPAEVAAGGSVTVSWTAPAGSPDKDWIAIYQDADTGSQFKAYVYTHGAATGSWHTTVRGAAGHTFRFRYLANDGYAVKAISNAGVSKPIAPVCSAGGSTASNIKHLVVIVQENKSFDGYFGNYCAAATGSNPACTSGPACCEKAPLTVQGAPQTVLNDNENASHDPNHAQACELSEIDGGRMDKFVSGAACSNPRNFAVADKAALGAYWDYAAKYAMADRCFQSVAGASSSNDMYLARGAFVFVDNSVMPDATGKECAPGAAYKNYAEPTVGDLLDACSVPWTWYGGGYKTKLTDKDPGHCYPSYYDPSDNPFQYYSRFTDKPQYNKDYSEYAAAISSGTLPAVSFVKALGSATEHGGSPISPGVAFVKATVDAVLNAPAYRDNTLIILTYDEGGGYYDHVAPPADSPVDGQPYGPRQPFMALGAFAKTNTVSHVPMELASVLAFIEWNWLGKASGLLQTRDAVANNLGSLLDSAKTGATVPSGPTPTALERKGGTAPRAAQGIPEGGLLAPEQYLGRDLKKPE